MKFSAFRRADGSVGIRNKILIVAVDECCDGIARQIAKESEHTVVLTNWLTCMLGGNEETYRQLIAVSENPNVAGVIVIAMGCGSIEPEQIQAAIAHTKKPCKTYTSDKLGGTRATIEAGKQSVREIESYIATLEKTECMISDLVIGIKCGGSDTLSGITANPCVGKAIDRLIDLGATCIGGELFELLGCEEILAGRAVSQAVADKIVTLIENEERRWSVPGVDIETMSIGNCVGGLTTIEEKSLGALYKMGSKPIQDVLQINKDFIDKPTEKGFYLSEATMLCGGAGVNYASHGAHIILWTTAAAGFNNAVVPVIRVSGNKKLLNADIDVDASGMIDGSSGVEAISEIIIEKVLAVAAGELTSIEGLGDSTMTLYQKEQRVETLLNLQCVK